MSDRDHTVPTPPMEKTQVSVPAGHVRAVGTQAGPPGGGPPGSAATASPTAQTSPAAGASVTSPTSATSTSAASLGTSGRSLTPDDAMRVQDAQRLRVFVPFVLGLTSLVLGAMVILGGDPLARGVMTGGLAIAALGALWVWRGLARHPELLGYYQTGFGACVVIAINCAFYYWGVLSPALLVVPFSAFLLTSSHARGLTAVAGGIALVGGHLGLSLLTMGGVLVDRGVFSPRDSDPVHQLVALVLVHFVFLATYGMAKQVRTAARRTLDDLNLAARDVAQRELLLAEARQDLNQALRIGGPGRYTEQVIGSYRLGVVLGRGGMGEVYEATHITTGGLCALKLLYPHLLADPAHHERFLREARLAASLDARNVVRVLGMSGVTETPPYLVMERLTGRDLGTVLKSTPRLVAAEALDMVRQVADGLTAAHAAGIVHRDLKPQNLFRCDGPHDRGSEAARALGGGATWKILDFGASKLGERGTLTEGVVVGTPQYMPPEQARGAVVGMRADIYSLAVIAYRALTGFPAFSGNDTPAVLFAVTSRMPERPSAIAPLPPQVDDVLALGMAKDPAQRFASAGELAEHLAAALEGRVDPEVRARAWRLAADWPWGVAGADRAAAERAGAARARAPTQD